MSQIPAASPPPTGLWRQFSEILRAMYASPVGRVAVILAMTIVVVVGLTAWGQVRLNVWHKDFFDALSRRDMREFLLQLGVFFALAGVLLVLNVGQRWLVETLKLRLREGLVRDLVALWMRPRRAFWLAHAGVVNPDQRMHDDARNLCDMTSDLSVGLLQASILFLSFAGVLWGLSSDFSIHWRGVDYAVPGFMLWAAIVYAAAGSLLSWWVGRPLVARNAERYEREADLRAALLRINEHLDAISLAGGEDDERHRVERHLAALLASFRRLVRGLVHLTWVTAGFGWMTTVAPILVAAPLYFSGKVSFGGLMMAAAAFTQAQGSLRWFVDNFSILADWRATLLRVAGFREMLTADPGPAEQEPGIRYVDGPAGELRAQRIEIAVQSGRDRVQEADISLKRGERVLIACAPGTGKAQLFQALAGLWPWGSGEVVRPGHEPVAYVPRGTPYLPRGSLREVLAYPEDPARFAPEVYVRALQRLGLERLVVMLDESRRWDRELSQDEQLALSFARLVVQSPPWIVLDEVLGTMDEERMVRVAEVIAQDLAGAGLIHIGQAVHGYEALFSRVLHLVKAEPAR